MKTFITNTWRKPEGKALLVALCAAASILLYFAVAQVAYSLFGSTLIPNIGRPPVQAQAQSTDDAEIKRLSQPRLYSGPGSPNYQPPAPPQAPGH